MHEGARVGQTRGEGRLEVEQSDAEDFARLVQRDELPRRGFECLGAGSVRNQDFDPEIVADDRFDQRPQRRYGHEHRACVRPFRGRWHGRCGQRAADKEKCEGIPSFHRCRIVVFRKDTHFMPKACRSF